MNKKEKFSENEINDFISNIDVPIGEEKESLWYEKFESLVNKQNSSEHSLINIFRFSWKYGIAASIAVIFAVTIYLNDLTQNYSDEVLSVELSISEEELFADQTMIESLFVDDNEFDDWFEERYVLNSLN